MIPLGHSPAYSTGWEDARTGKPMPQGASPAYAEGYNDMLAAQCGDAAP